MTSHQVNTGVQPGPVVRRLRFEDETEKEAESRYQDRWRAGGRIQRGGATPFSVLPSKPRLRLSVKDRGAEPRVKSGFSLKLPRPPDDARERGRSFTRPRPCGLSMPIRETYIGHVTHCETSRELHDHQARAPPLTTWDLPVNPYACDGPVTVAGQPWLAPPPTSVHLPIEPSFLAPPHCGRRSPATHQHQKNRPLVAAAQQSSCSRTAGGSRETHHFFLTMDVKRAAVTSDCSSSSSSSSSSSDNEQQQQPTRAELSSDSSAPNHVSSRPLADVTSARPRSSSLDRLGHSLSPDSTPWTKQTTSSRHRTSLGALRRSPSVQSLTEQVAPVLQLLKPWSTLSVSGGQKKKKRRSKEDRSAAYRVADDQ